jgi:hypothetical protein
MGSTSTYSRSKERPVANVNYAQLVKVHGTDADPEED